MSKNPKIYGFCDAGCRWETVHMEDFQRSASMVEVSPESDGTYRLEKGKTYRLLKGSDSSDVTWGFRMTAFAPAYYTDTGELYGMVEKPVNLPTKQDYNDFLKVRFLDFFNPYQTRTVVIEFDGVRQTQTETWDDGGAVYRDQYVIVTGAQKCYLINESAEILAHVDYDRVNQHVDEVIDDTLSQVYGVGTAVVGNTLKIWCDERFNPVTVSGSVLSFR